MPEYFDLVGTLTDNYFIDQRLYPGTTYYYMITACVGGQEGTPSDYACATTDSFVYNVKADGISASEIEVSWDQTGNAKQYWIYSSLSESGTYTLINTTNELEYRDTGLDPDTTYYYKVAMREYGPAYPVPATTYPLPKLNLDANTVSTSEIDLTWNAVSGAMYYDVYRSTYNGGYTVIAPRVTSTEFKNTGLTASTTYWYKVVTSNGVEDVKSATTLEEIPVLTATAIDTQSIQLDWTSVINANQYKIYSSSSENGPYTEIGTAEYATTFTNTGLDHSTTYYYKVAAYNGWEGSHSNIASATTLKPAIGVPDVEAEALNTSSIKVTWNEIPGAYDYNIYRSLTEDGTYDERVGVVDAAEKTEFVDTGLDHSTTYHYKVAVYNGEDMGDQSAPANATTKTPEKPTNPGNGGSGEVKVTGKSTKTIAPGFETPVENEVVQVDEVQAGAAGFVFPFFLILAVLTTGVLYVRAKKRQNKIE